MKELIRTLTRDICFHDGINFRKVSMQVRRIEIFRQFGIFKRLGTDNM
jgi:hypothetical protein